MAKTAIKTRQIQSKPIKRRKTKTHVKTNMVDDVHNIMVKKGFSHEYWRTHSGLSLPTIAAMLKGKTTQPYFSTLEAILQSVGHKFLIVPVGKAQIVPIAPVKRVRNVKFRYLRPPQYRVKKKG